MNSPTVTEPVSDRRVPFGHLRAFSILNGLVLLGVLLQGLSAGGLMGRLGYDWAQVHQFSAYAVIILSLAAAILATVGLRRARPGVAVWSCVLFLLLVVQTALGQAISDGHEHALLAVHVPFALLIMALGGYLSVTAVRLRH